MYGGFFFDGNIGSFDAFDLQMAFCVVVFKLCSVRHEDDGFVWVLGWGRMLGG